MVVSRLKLNQREKTDFTPTLMQNLIFILKNLVFPFINRVYSL